MPSQSTIAFYFLALLVSIVKNRAVSASMYGANAAVSYIQPSRGSDCSYVATAAQSIVPSSCSCIGHSIVVPFGPLVPLSNDTNISCVSSEHLCGGIHRYIEYKLAAVADFTQSLRLCTPKLYYRFAYCETRGHACYVSITDRQKIVRKLVVLSYLTSVRNMLPKGVYLANVRAICRSGPCKVETLFPSCSRAIIERHVINWTQRIKGSSRCCSEDLHPCLDAQSTIASASDFTPEGMVDAGHGSSSINFVSDSLWGGGIARYATFEELASKIIDVDGNGDTYMNAEASSRFKFAGYFLNSDLYNSQSQLSGALLCRLELGEAAVWMMKKEILEAAKSHGVAVNSKLKREDAVACLEEHFCSTCTVHLCAFEEIQKVSVNSNVRTKAKQRDYRRRETAKLARNSEAAIADVNDPKLLVDYRNATEAIHDRLDAPFPPPPPSDELIEQVINGFCEDSDPRLLEESGCKVCGRLFRMSEMADEGEIPPSYDVLVQTDVTRLERTHSDCPIEGVPGPVMDVECVHVCVECYASLRSGRRPKHALANGLWLGAVPHQLRTLSFAERMMIARVRHNRCLVRVASGRAKMTANVIMYSNPTLKVYKSLPPSPSELNEVLAFVFTGPSQPTEEDFKRCPMLVRRVKVLEALEWLKLNHSDYADLSISEDNLAMYPLSGVPVHVDFRRIPDDTLRDPVAAGLHYNDDEGSSDGPCPFTVHGLSGSDYGSMSIQALKARALRHLESEGKMLAIGHAAQPESMYDNPQAYPQMFPWLFPYGLGGIGQERHKRKFSEEEHKKHLLMYHDKRFQCDLYFPIVAFNHTQMKCGSSGSFLTTKRQNFAAISKRLSEVDKVTLKDLTTRLANGEHVKPESEQEKVCYKILDDIDHVGGYVKGSLTSKKYMRNEIWSLLSFLGAPSWFITLSPADNRHPISIYYADTKETFRPDILSSSDRNRMMAQNPVAAARFFHVMVNLFLKHVLGVGSGHPGLYGDTAAYYGTVEQQGRLTLHLHTLVWIRGALSPQEIRDRLIGADSEFRSSMIAYLEGSHRGDFMTGSMQHLRDKLPSLREDLDGIHSISTASVSSSVDAMYVDPTLTMPTAAPSRCVDNSCGGGAECAECDANSRWWREYCDTVDDIVLKSNVHRCGSSGDSGGSKNDSDRNKSIKVRKGCLDKEGNCKARFPRPLYKETMVDETDGHMFMKKLEPMINTFTPALSYLTRCNTDVTSLLSGTSIKAIVSYISDYISKPALKTYQVFSSMYDVFDREDGADQEVKSETGGAGRRILLKIVNSLSSKMEIGSPMASMYLLGHPDHYTDHEFAVFWWKSYVSEVLKMAKDSSGADTSAECQVESIKSEDVETVEDKVVIGRHDGKYVGSNNVDDYKYRPLGYSGVALYEWIQSYDRRKLTPAELSRRRLRDINTESGNANDNSEDALYGGGSTNREARMVEEAEQKSARRKRNTYLPFCSDHPLFSTHVVRCDFSRMDKVVPNFVGGPLPRADKGDREYYCCTMLTLFKPWRCLSDLKGSGQSWDSAFREYVFDDRHQRIMQNFNLRYECLDAKDDYKSERERKGNKGSGAYPQDMDICESVDDCAEGDFTAELHEDYADIDTPGTAYRHELECKREADSIMNETGWLLRDASVREHGIIRFFPEISKTHGEWASLVKGERAKLFKQKLSGYVPNQSASLGGSLDTNCNDVTIKSSDYLLRTYKSDKVHKDELTRSVVVEFSLNEEQERAFRIIANHSNSLAPEQLKMYLGGMGGTGKSQVIKAVVSLFRHKGEAHRFIILGPTGTSAALLSGSTYHSALGIHSRSERGADYSRNESSVINEVRSRLQGVQYIFIDEISMVSCRELYSISQRLSQVFNSDTVFGGVNMILAGDFAQLPPVGNMPFYSPLVSCVQSSGMRPSDQEAMLGKIFWHQFTTVVVLKQNMRQRSQSDEDARLRTALENMRYAACTATDIAFLNSRVASSLSLDGKPILAHPDFRNVSVITAWNSQKDRFNEQGAARFAADNGQTLTTFYSVDSLSSQDGASRGRKRSNGTASRTKKLIKMSDKLQAALWGCSPCATDHVASKLSVCVGMPVLIRNNDATELCITKGQEAVVVGWDSYDGPTGRLSLNTLFVMLVKPPQVVSIPGLPTNVVPIPRTSTRVNCTLKSGVKVVVQRQQVLVLPNFAMTDYSSQGKTREFNVVHAEHCRDHMSYYTCLSRSASAAGTVLMQPVDALKISKGISGHLRQEFRELNVLDKVTALRYTGELPDGILQPLRNPTVRNYMVWCAGSSFDDGWHNSLAYAKGEDRIRSVEDDATWDPTYLTERLKIVRAGKKRSRGAADVHDGAARSIRNVRPNTEITSRQPRGFVWDSSNYSCAYDSVFTLLYNVWAINPERWGRRFRDISMPLEMMCGEFERCYEARTPLENARDVLRRTMTTNDPASFPAGSRYTYVHNVVSAMMVDRNRQSLESSCARCVPSPVSELVTLVENTARRRMFSGGSTSAIPLSTALRDRLTGRRRTNGIACGACTTRLNDGTVESRTPASRVPYILWIELLAPTFTVDTEFAYHQSDMEVKFNLAGVVYGGQGHFVSRFVDSVGTVWFNDGMTTGSSCEVDFRLADAMDAAEELRHVDVDGKRKVAIYAVYIRE